MENKISSSLIPRLLKGLGILIIAVGIAGCGQKNDADYGVFIGATASDMEKICQYNLVVIDADGFTAEEIDQIKQSGSTVYTYLNLGSLEQYRDYYDDYKDLSLGVYENWEDEVWIDVTDEGWQSHCIELAESFKEKGVDGFFIDNCDVYYNYQTEEIFKAITDILKQLSDIDSDILINGGDTYVTKYINEYDEKIFSGVNQECVYTTIDFDNNKLTKANEEDYKYFKNYLDEVSSKGYKTYVLEYSNNTFIKSKINRLSKKNNWITYISSDIALD